MLRKKAPLLTILHVGPKPTEIYISWASLRGKFKGLLSELYISGSLLVYCLIVS